LKKYFGFFAVPCCLTFGACNNKLSRFLNCLNFFHCEVIYVLEFLQMELASVSGFPSAADLHAWLEDLVDDG
jgi:hypothetical protein